MLSPGQTITAFQRNISQHCLEQYVACVWSPCCVVLRHVATCWMLLAQIWKCSNSSCNICGCRVMMQSFGQVVMLHPGMRTSSVDIKYPTYRNALQQGGRTHTACRDWQCWDMLRSNVAIVWSEFANAEPAMLGYVGLKCCDRLAGALGLEMKGYITRICMGISVMVFWVILVMYKITFKLKEIWKC